MFTPLMEELVRTAANALFVVTATELKPMVDPGEVHARIQLQLEEPDDAEWAAIPLLYSFASLSFADARARGYSETQFNADDVLMLEDFLPSVEFTKRGLQWSGDYIKGRRMKTSLCVSLSGQVTIETTERGEAATRWVARLQGKRSLQAV